MRVRYQSRAMRAVGAGRYFRHTIAAVARHDRHVGTPAHRIRLARKLVRDGPVAIIGTGPIGPGAVFAAPPLGFADRSNTDPGAHRLHAAQTPGAQNLDAAHAPRRFPLVLDNAGVSAARQRALELTAPGGVGMFRGESERWEIDAVKAIRRKNFFIAPSFHFPLHSHATNIKLLRPDRARFAPLVDATVPLNGLHELFASFAA